MKKLLICVIVILLLSMVVSIQIAKAEGIKIRLCLYAWDMLDYSNMERHVTYHCYMLGDEMGNYCEAEPWQVQEVLPPTPPWTTIGYWYMCENMGEWLYIPVVVR